MRRLDAGTNRRTQFRGNVRGVGARRACPRAKSKGEILRGQPKDLLGEEKEWSALADDSRTWAVAGRPDSTPLWR